MTCIVGMVHKGSVIIGGDSVGVAGWRTITRVDKKVFRTGNVIFGFTSSFRMGQILQYKLQIPTYDDRVDLMKYMVVDFIDAIRTCFRDAGIMHLESNKEVGGTFLVGIRGRLFCIETDFQVGEPEGGIYSVGAGDPYALAVLHSHPEKDPKKKMKIALETAAHFSGAVRGPFHFETLEAEK